MDAAADAHRIQWRHRRSSSVRQIQGVTHGVWRNETRATQTMTGSQARRGEMPRRGNTSPRTSSCARPAVYSRRVGCVAAPASTSASSGPDRCPAHRSAPSSGSAGRPFAALDGPGREDGARRRAEMVRRAIRPARERTSPCCPGTATTRYRGTWRPARGPHRTPRGRSPVDFRPRNHARP